MHIVPQNKDKFTIGNLFHCCEALIFTHPLVYEFLCGPKHMATPVKYLVQSRLLTENLRYLFRLPNKMQNSKNIKTARPEPVKLHKRLIYSACTYLSSMVLLSSVCTAEICTMIRCFSASLITANSLVVVSSSFKSASRRRRVSEISVVHSLILKYNSTLVRDFN